MAQEQRKHDPKNARFWNKKDLVEVLIVDTGVRTVVCRDYQKAYANEGVVYLNDYVAPAEEPVVEEKPAPKAKAAPKVEAKE